MEQTSKMSSPGIQARWQGCGLHCRPGSSAPAAGSAPATAEKTDEKEKLEELNDDMRFGLFS